MARTREKSACTLALGALLVSSAWAQQPAGAPPKKDKDAGRNQQSFQQSRPLTSFQIGPFGKRRGAGAPPAGEWLRKYHNLPPQEQQKLLESDTQFQQLPPDRQEKLRDRLKEFNSRTPEEQQRMLDRMAKFDNLSDAQKQQLEKVHQRMHEIPEQRRGVVRREFQLLQQMTPEQRLHVMSSDSYRTTFSEDEREIIKAMSEVQGSADNKEGDNRPPNLEF